MRTIDTSNIITRALAAYPEGSVSKREVVATLPCDDPAKQAWELNGLLTRAIYAYWQAATLAKPKHHLRARDELTKLAQDVVLKLGHTM